jgi:hypothetical protein
MNTSARPEANRRVLLFLVLLAAVLFLGSILFIISRAQT